MSAEALYAIVLGAVGAAYLLALAGVLIFWCRRAYERVTGAVMFRSAAAQ